MPSEPSAKRTIAFIDGQNLYFAAKAAFGYTYPNYDPEALARAVCAQQGWDLVETRFYTGIPESHVDARWHGFWNNKLLAMRRRGIHVFSRSIRNSKEKGVDVRIAIDVIRKVHQNHCDVALIFSQDQDLSEVARELRIIAKEQSRWIRIASAYPDNPGRPRGINGTDWLPIDKANYDTCIDPRNYRLRR